MKEWSGTATELIKKYDLNISPNALSKRLNVNTDRMLNEYHIIYENNRNHDGRYIKFVLVEEQM